MMSCGVVVILGLALWFVSVSQNGQARTDEAFSSPTPDYGDALGKAILFFEGQRSGKLPASQRVKWRGDSALSDGNLENVKLIGGYYDAGDNVNLVTSIVPSSGALVIYWKLTLHQQPSIPRWEMEIQITSVGNALKTWIPPRTLYKITADSPGTEAAAESAAALSAASIVFKKVDANYSSRLLSQSQTLFDFADKYRGSYKSSCPFYCSYSGYEDELLWAAAWLYKASGESKYLSYVSSNQRWSQAVSEFSWDNKFVGAQTLLAQEFYGGKKDLSKFKTDADSFICSVMPGSSSLQITMTPGGLLYIRDSSNLQYVTSTTMVLFIYSKVLNAAHIDGIQCGSVHFTASQIRTFAKTQVDYILGDNPMKMSFMVGYGSKYPMQLHHRGSSIPSINVHPAKVGCSDGSADYYSSTKPNPNTHVGAIVGGPNSIDRFNDARS
ncbi:Endoglucanase [Quillaja saponaria]|uniref:Endoglucanase n=1 Tax=Quillaja saponaria TaxID=32244 RepID=A0AAD7L647_QUISA|nr:Endoglucanase [Quillaja saponaria]